MPNLRNILRYLRHYGFKSTVGLIREKLLVDPKRFSVNKKRKLPDFPKDYNKLILEKVGEGKSGYTVLFALHYFYPEKKGGTERFTLNIAKEAIARGNRAVILVLDANRPMSDYTDRCGNIFYRYYEFEGIKCIGFRHKKAPLGLYYKDVRLDDTEMRAFMHHLTEREGIDIVHATYPQPFASFLDECRLCGLPYIVTCTDFCMMCHYSTMVDDNGDFCRGTEGCTRCSRVCPTYGCKDYKARYKAAEQVLIGAAVVTVPSEFVARVMSLEFARVSFLPVNHGISEAFEYRERTGRVKKIVYAGTISQLKGIHLLISAFCRLEGDDLTLEIYGSGDDRYEGTLRKMADSRVKFMGAAPGSEMPRIYSEADCVVIPSMWYETYNFVLREAANTGALVLAADIGAMPEAVREGENGYLFKASDEESLFEGLKKCLDFDFKDYRSQSYPKTRDEGEIYAGIYENALK